jgi:hypothetical protein
MTTAFGPSQSGRCAMSWTVLVAGTVSALVAAGAQLLNARYQVGSALRRQYEYEERKKLRALIGRYQGRVLEAALDWRRRMGQIYQGEYIQLDPPDDRRRDDEQYYFQSVVFRFLQLTGIARRFEAEAFYFDPHIACDEDFDLLRYAKAFLWVMVHPELSPDDGLPGLDHFRSDSFRPLLDLCYATPQDDDGRTVLPETRSRDDDIIFDRPRYLALMEHAEQLGQGREFDELLAFFDGVRPDDRDASGRQRRRWDRLVTLHLLVLAFIATCGYRWQGNHLDPEVDQAVHMLLYPEDVATQLDRWARELGLSTALRHVRARLATAIAELPPGETATAREQRVLARVSSREVSATSAAA